MADVELMRRTDMFQDAGLPDVSILAARALEKAGVKGAFSVKVELNVPQNVVIDGKEQLVYTSTTHMPGQMEGHAQALSSLSDADIDRIAAAIERRQAQARDLAYTKGMPFSGRFA